MFIRVTNQLSAKVAQNVLIKIHEKINIELHDKGLHIKYYKNLMNNIPSLLFQYFGGRFSNFTKIAASVYSLVSTEKLINTIVNFCFQCSICWIIETKN